MILATTALALAGSLFVMGAQTVHISTLTMALNLCLWILVVMLLAGATYALHCYFMRGGLT